MNEVQRQKEEIKNFVIKSPIYNKYYSNEFIQQNINDFVELAYEDFNCTMGYTPIEYLEENARLDIFEYLKIGKYKLERSANFSYEGEWEDLKTDEISDFIHDISEKYLQGEELYIKDSQKYEENFNDIVDTFTHSICRRFINSLDDGEITYDEDEIGRTYGSGEVKIFEPTDHIYNILRENFESIDDVCSEMVIKDLDTVLNSLNISIEKNSKSEFKIYDNKNKTYTSDIIESDKIVNYIKNEYQSQFKDKNKLEFVTYSTINNCAKRVSDFDFRNKSKVKKTDMER